MKPCLCPFAFAIVVLLGLAQSALGQPDTLSEVAPGVFFHQGDSSRGHCNNGWVLFDDHVLVVDANFPSGARVIMPKIAESTELPVRIVDQQQFFIEVLKRAKALRDAGRSAAEAQAAVTDIDRELKAIPTIARYVGDTARDKIEKAWRELGGEPFPR